MDLVIRFYKRNSFVLILALYFVLVFIIGLSGEFPVNDDWIFKRQVDAFQVGIKPLSELIDPSFIFQGGVGFVWAEIFGSAFSDLRRLTVFHFVVFMFGLYKVLGILKLSDSIKFLTFVTLCFNPLIFFSSFTFMTEIYFLAYALWGMYFFLRYFDSRKLGFLVFALLFTSFTILIRQIGVALFFAYLLAEAHSILFLKSKVTKRLAFDVLLGLTFISTTFYFWYLWPKVVKPGADDVLKGLISPDRITTRLANLWMILPYLGYFLLPLSIYNLVRLETRKIRLALLGISLIPAATLYRYDVFPLGNVLYVENFLTRTNFQLTLSVFDNVPYKLFLAYLVSLGLVYIFYYVYSNFIKKKQASTLSQKYLLFCSVLLLASILISSDFYDRYLLPALVPFVLFIGVSFEKNLSVVKRNYFKLPVTLVVLLFIFSAFTLTQEYIVQTRIRWLLAEELRSTTGYTTQIHVDSTYGKYMNSLSHNDFAGLDSGDPISDYVCFVDNYTLEGTSSWARLISRSDEVFSDAISKPRVYNSQKIQGLPKIKNNLDELMVNVEYRSVLYNLVGKKSFVGAWCEDVV